MSSSIEDTPPAGLMRNPNKGLPQYESMNSAEIKHFREKVAFVAKTYPSAGFIGGTAMRIRCDEQGLPVPAEGSGDFDLSVQHSQKPEPWYWEVEHTSGAIPLDTVDTWTPFKEPYYTRESYQGAELYVATLPHALVRKAVECISKDKTDEQRQKDRLYLEILEALVTPEQVQSYLETYAKEAPPNIKLSPALLAFIAAEGFLDAKQAA